MTFYCSCHSLVYFLALEKCNSLGSSAIAIFIEELLRLHHGQGLDILWRENGDCPSEEQYEKMVLEKTGGLFRLAVRLMQCFSDNKSNFGPLLDQLALYFQIRDDLLGLNDKEQGKILFEDITEGKLSFPVIHALRTHAKDTRLLSILRQRTDDAYLKAYAVRWLRQCGSLTYTREKLRTIHDQLVTLLRELGGKAESRLGALLERLEAQLDDMMGKEAAPP